MKDKRWREIRQQRRREKARLYKLHKPVRETVHSPPSSTPEEELKLGAHGRMMARLLFSARHSLPSLARERRSERQIYLPRDKTESDD